LRRSAETEESTPPDIPTTTVWCEGSQGASRDEGWLGEAVKKRGELKEGAGNVIWSGKVSNLDLKGQELFFELRSF
jgi:hypothetical protein